MYKYKKSEKVIYPRFGAGRIIDKCVIRVDGEKEQYFRIQFIDPSIIISVPASKADSLGLRKPMTRRNLRKELTKLGNEVKITDSKIKQLDDYTREKLLSGEVNDTISLVNTLKSLAKKKREESKNFSYTASEKLKTALEFLRSEIELVLGKKALGKYDLS